jgi:hypothetical protein
MNHASRHTKLTPLIIHGKQNLYHKKYIYAAKAFHGRKKLLQNKITEQSSGCSILPSTTAST